VNHLLFSIVGGILSIGLILTGISIGLLEERVKNLEKEVSK